MVKIEGRAGGLAFVRRGGDSLMATDKQKKFVEMYLGEAELNAKKAAILAGYSEKTAEQVGYQLLQKTTVQKLLGQRRKELAIKTEITPEKVLRIWWELANVDINELVEYRRDCCRHCWGENHQYQWTEGEFVAAQKEAAEKREPPPGKAGGFGYLSTREPNSECPECQGEGWGKIYVHDTRRLKGAARRLYAGVQQGKDGLKVLMSDRDRALENVARHLGMFSDRLVHTGDKDAPIHVNTNLTGTVSLTDGEKIAAIRQRLRDSC